MYPGPQSLINILGPAATSAALAQAGYHLIPNAPGSALLCHSSRGVTTRMVYLYVGLRAADGQFPSPSSLLYPYGRPAHAQQLPFKPPGQADVQTGYYSVPQDVHSQQHGPQRPSPYHLRAMQQPLPMLQQQYRSPYAWRHEQLPRGFDYTPGSQHRSPYNQQHHIPVQQQNIDVSLIITPGSSSSSSFCLPNGRGYLQQTTDRHISSSDRIRERRKMLLLQLMLLQQQHAYAQAVPRQPHPRAIRSQLPKRHGHHSIPELAVTALPWSAAFSPSVDQEQLHVA
jgi:hypothetical protein